MSKVRVVFAVLVAFSLFNTTLLVFELTGYHPWPANNSGQYGLNAGDYLLAQLQVGSYAFAPISWGLVVGAWIWRGRIKSQWTQLGLTEDLFRLLMKMRGSGTRALIMSELETPKDRFQLSKDLGLDWTTVNYQVGVLSRYGLVTEDTAYGNVRLYKLTPIGAILLKALREMERNDSPLHPAQAS